VATYFGLIIFLQASIQSYEVQSEHIMHCGIPYNLQVLVIFIILNYFYVQLLN